METLEEEIRVTGEVYRVFEVAKQSFEQNGHRNSLLRGRFDEVERLFGAGDYYVPMDNRLANLIFYLLEPESDDGLAYWNFFDELFASEMFEDTSAIYPVFKIFAHK